MKYLMMFLLAAVLVAGCEILEEDISSRRVEILAPADRATTVSGPVEFRWRAMADAVGYEFTLVSPSFAAAGGVVADTVVYADSLSRHFRCRADLAPGVYQWRVTAFNSGYETQPEVRTLTVVKPEEPEESEE